MIDAPGRIPSLGGTVPDTLPSPVHGGPATNTIDVSNAVVIENMVHGD